MHGDRARRAGSCEVPGASSDVAWSMLALLSAAAARGTAWWGCLGRRPECPAQGGGGGSAGTGGEGGRRARGRVGMDNQHLGRNPSRWFPPSTSEGSEIGPCEPGGGSERRVCVRARTGRRGSLFPPAKETQPRGNGAESIIKAGKRRWERRGGAWGGGFTRPGSDYTALGASFPRSIPHTPALRTWTYPPRPPPGRASSSSRAPWRCVLEPCPCPAPRPWGPLLPGVSQTAAQKRYTPTHVAGWDCL